MKQMMDLSKTVKHIYYKHAELDIETNGKTEIP